MLKLVPGDLKVDKGVDVLTIDSPFSLLVGLISLGKLGLLEKTFLGVVIDLVKRPEFG